MQCFCGRFVLGLYCVCVCGGVEELAMRHMK